MRFPTRPPPRDSAGIRLPPFLIEFRSPGSVRVTFPQYEMGSDFDSAYPGTCGSQASCELGEVGR